MHISGNSNIVADTLSRVETITVLPEIYEELAAAQETDEELKKFLKGTTSLRLQQLNLPGAFKPIYCDTSTPYVRPFIPQQMRRSIFDAVHNMAHPAKRPTLKQISQKYVWPSMRKDLRGVEHVILASELKCTNIPEVSYVNF